MITNNTAIKQETFIKMVMDAWNSKVKRLDNLLSELDDQQLLKEVAPGRNQGIYILGHLTEVNNAMLPLLDSREIMSPDVFKTFLQTANKDIVDLPSVNEVRQEWINVKTALATQFLKMQPNDWFQKHTNVSEEDFAKEPHRNKLNVVITRTNHLDYHIGQLVFLKKK
ncbi:MAG: DinB family protein [Chitinophagaceae bacterium]